MKPDIEVESALCPMAIFSQRKTLEDFVSNRAFVRSGLISRQLISEPNPRAGNRQDIPIQMQRHTREEWNGRVTRILRAAWKIAEAGQGKVTIPLDPDAVTAIRDFHNSADRLSATLPRESVLRTWVMKSHGMVIRVAALLVIYEDAHSIPKIKVEHIERAVEIVNFHYREMERIDNQTTGDAIEGNALHIATRVLAWVQRDSGRKVLAANGIVGTVSIRDLHRGLSGGSGRGTIRRAEDLEPGLELLMRRGYVKLLTRLVNGKAVTSNNVFVLHPLVLGQRVAAEVTE